MAKKQTRRSVSIRGATYEQIREYCERNAVSMSEFVEARIATFFGGAAVDVPVKAKPRAPGASAVPAASLPQKAKPSPAAKRPPARAGNGSGNGNGDSDAQRLSFDELQAAARYFTF